jgi:small-conductance mechanosensitive channel
VNRPVGYGSLLLGVAVALVAALVAGTPLLSAVDGADLLVRGLAAVAAVLVANGLYLLVSGYVAARATSRARAHEVRNGLRLVFGTLAVAAVLGILTNQWLGLLVSFGVVGFAVTFALQQPLLSALGWLYITVKRPYAVGDRVDIGGRKGDVAGVSLLVTELWE